MSPPPAAQYSMKHNADTSEGSTPSMACVQTWAVAKALSVTFDSRRYVSNEIESRCLRCGPAVKIDGDVLVESFSTRSRIAMHDSVSCLDGYY